MKNIYTFNEVMIIITFININMESFRKFIVNTFSTSINNRSPLLPFFSRFEQKPFLDHRSLFNIHCWLKRASVLLVHNVISQIKYVNMANSFRIIDRTILMLHKNKDNFSNTFIFTWIFTCLFYIISTHIKTLIVLYDQLLDSICIETSRLKSAF